MHLEILDSQRIELLEQLSNLSFIKSFKMGGGTALSLQLGLRNSFDFDFFKEEHFDTEEIVFELKKMFGENAEITNVSSKLSTVDAYICGVQVSFLEYRHKEIDNSVVLENFPQISLLSVKDIACMKAIDIDKRGTKKDFYDMYFILKNEFIKKNLSTLIYEKFNEKYLLTNFYQSMTYFEDARCETLPKSFVEYSWQEIESFFIQYSKEFLNSLDQFVED